MTPWPGTEGADGPGGLGGAARTNASGSSTSRMAAKVSKVFCQPTLSISPTASGENRNWPNEPAAVPAPKPMVRHGGGNSLAKAPITKVNEQPARPNPISTPADM